ncbi:hypothetical protein BH10CYA1_BH10CYA1_27700 [soil metagenome]
MKLFKSNSKSSKGREITVRSNDTLLSWPLAAGIVGADIGTSVFYSTALILPYTGFAAPIVIFIVCVLMWFFKSIYQEGCAASPFNGGAYMIMLQTVGRRPAMVVGALTILSYLATAAVSSISGAYYLDSIDNISNWPVALIAFVASLPVIFFGFLNIVGIKEPARIVFAIAFFHFSLLLCMDIYGLWFAILHHVYFLRIFEVSPVVTPITMIHGFAAAFLGITGFESAAQIVEQLKTPTWRTLRNVYTAIVILVGITAPLTSFLCVILLSDTELKLYSNNLLSGLAYVEGGSTLLVILVLDACLTLFAAVNTAYAGCIGLCTTMAKQGNLPAMLLRRWDKKHPLLQGYPIVCLSFMAISLLMIALLPGQLENLGQIYGMAFLGVMIAFALGVLLLRVKMPLKVARSPYQTRFLLKIGGVNFSVSALIGVVVLTFAEVVLFANAEGSRTLGLQMFVFILLAMLFYRLGVVESRISELPDLRLGLGKFAGLEQLPDNLPTFVLCTEGAKSRELITQLLNLLKSEIPGPKEVIVYHSEEESARRGVMFELLQRVISQQVAPAFKDQDLILTVKVMPEPLIEGLLQLKRARTFKRIFVGEGSEREQSLLFARDIETNIEVPTVLIEQNSK